MNLVDGEPWLTPNTIPPHVRFWGGPWSELIYNFWGNQGEEATFPTLTAAVKIVSLKL